jgi:ABC-type multidrug transport system ATPase subunit
VAERGCNVQSSSAHPALQGCFTLLMGAPGSGKSTLLKALSGKLHHGSGSMRIMGDITYNGHM